MNKEIMSAAYGLLANVVKGGEKGNIESCSIQVDSVDYTYQVYVPAEIESAQKLPLIVFLHGIGQRGNGGFVPTTGTGGAFVNHYFAQVPAVILLPQCRLGSYWSDPVMDRMVMQEINQTIQEFGVDEKRIYLTGVSMGGYGVWHFASEHAGKFAALVSICGGSPITKGDRFSPLAEKVDKTPAWIFHGADDKIVQVSESRQIVDALKANGGNVKYSEYAGIGHNVWLNALAEKDLMSWLLEQKLE